MRKKEEYKNKGLFGVLFWGLRIGVPVSVVLNYLHDKKGIVEILKAKSSEQERTAFKLLR